MSLLASWLASPPADAAVEIAPGRVSAAALTSRSGDLGVQAWAVEAIPPGAVVPSLTGQNVFDRAAVTMAIRTVLGRLGWRPSRVALVIPDIAAKVSLVRFDQIPVRRDDLDQLVRWQVRKSAPFAIDEACITYSAGARPASGGGEFVVVLARRDVIEEYERVCSDAGAYAGLVDLSTLSVINLFLAAAGAPAGDWLLVHMRPEYTSIAIMRGADVVFFRNKPEDEDETLTDVVHQTAMYYQDRLAGQGFRRVLLGGSGRDAGSLETARRSLEERLGVMVEPIDPATLAPLPARSTVTGDLTDVLAPLVGMLLRTHREGVTS